MKKGKVFLSLFGIVFVLYIIYSTINVYKIDEIETYLPTVTQMNDTFQMDGAYTFEKENYRNNKGIRFTYTITDNVEENNDFMTKIVGEVVLDETSLQNHYFASYLEFHKETISKLNTQDKNLELYLNQQETTNDFFGIYRNDSYQIYFVVGMDHQIETLEKEKMISAVESFVHLFQLNENN